jgi:predicted  nucleic acid-binding Zn ribbon protein
VLTERRSKVAMVEVRALADAWVAAGQLVGPFAVGEYHDGYRIAGTVPLADALSEDHESDVIAGIRARLVDDFDVEIDIEIAEHDEPCEHAPSLEVATELYLGSDGDVRRSPLLCDAGLHMPLYLVPVAHELRAEIMVWSEVRQALRRIEAADTGLERRAGQVLSAPTGAHAERGRELAAAIESATGLPSYYTMYCPVDLVADLSACLSCGAELEVRVGPAGNRLRLCAGCRLAASE